MTRLQRVGLGFVLVAITAVGLVAKNATVATAQIPRYWRNTAGSSTWNTPANWSSASAGDTNPATNGVPLVNDPVNIVNSDALPHTVTLNVNPPSLGLLTINYTGPGAGANTLSMTSSNNLTANAIFVGGWTGGLGGIPTNGRGAITQSAGKISTNAGGDWVLGRGIDSTGTYTLSGTGEVVAAQSLFIGYLGTGVFNHSDGKTTINPGAIGSLNLGNLALSSGTYNLSGAGELISNKSIYVGDSGVGFFRQIGGTNTINGAANNLYVGYSTGGSGSYDISGTAKLNVGGNAIIGSSGTGSLSILGQSSVYIDNSLTINSSSTVNLNGGTLRFNTVSGMNRLFFNAGTIRLAGDRNLLSDPTITTLLDGVPTVPAGKGLAVEGIASIYSNPAQTFRVNGGTFTTPSTLQIGDDFLEYDGHLEVTGGGIVNSGKGVIDPSLSASVTVTGPGSSWYIIDDLHMSNDGNFLDAVLNINDGGLVHVGTTLTLGNRSVLNLNGGTFRFNGYNLNPVGDFNFNSGTIQLGGDRSIGSDAVIIEHFGATTTIAAGKRLTVEGTGTVVPAMPVTMSGGTLAAGTVLLPANSRITATASSTVSGPILAQSGSLLDASGGDLALGDTNKVNGFYSNGTIKVGGASGDSKRRERRRTGFRCTGHARQRSEPRHHQRRQRPDAGFWRQYHGPRYDEHAK